ncbi:MAG TPA: tetratricopeptide repeat protein [Bacteroidales bacterium]|nr:tetratricopeptide repeat protein [Bacteroidales bacterium]
MRGKETAYRLVVAVICAAAISPSLHGQEEREYIRKGNRLYRKSEFAGSEGMYRLAEEEGKSSGDAVFNLGDALYRQNRFGEAAEEFSRAVQTGEADSLRQADGFYNLGNSLLKEQKFSESINAYINSLKLNPDNIQAKYNLAYAQDQLKKQEEQQQQQQDQDQNQDQNQDKQNQQDQQNKDQDDNKDQEQKQQDDQQQQQQEQQQQQSSMSREDAKRLLDALAANEKETQEKVQREKAAGARVRVIKNW